MAAAAAWRRDSCAMWHPLRPGRRAATASPTPPAPLPVLEAEAPPPPLRSVRSPSDPPCSASCANPSSVRVTPRCRPAVSGWLGGEDLVGVPIVHSRGKASEFGGIGFHFFTSWSQAREHFEMYPAFYLTCSRCRCRCRRLIFTSCSCTVKCFFFFRSKLVLTIQLSHHKQTEK